MRNSGKTFIASIIALFIISLFAVNKVQAQGNVRVSLDMFYDELSPYGYWDYDNNYGDIWYPRAERDFRPYSSNGYWAMTQYGNTWVSNYPWGWAPFHYGRWVHTPHNGWGWIPGYEWGPAWVEWRSGNGYYGWAPMAPRLSVNISVGIPINFWIFTPTARIYDRNMYRYSSYGRTNIYNNTTIINNTYIVNNNHYYGGPSRRDIERTTGRRVTVRDVQYSDRPGNTRVNNRSVSMYRPDLNDRYSSRATNERPNVVNRSTNTNTNNRVPQEMYIGRDGNATIRDRSDNSRVITSDRGSRTVDSPNRGESRTNTSSNPNVSGRSTNGRTTTESNGTVNRVESSRTNTSSNPNVSGRSTNGRTTTENNGTVNRSEGSRTNTPSNPNISGRSTSGRTTSESNGTVNRSENSRETAPRVIREAQQAPQRESTPSRERQRSTTVPVQQASNTRASSNSGSSTTNTSRTERSNSASTRSDESSSRASSTERSSTSRR